VLVVATTDTVGSTKGETGPTGLETAAKYIANWTELPSGIASGRLSNAPLLGNGDLGVSVGGSLPGKVRMFPPSTVFYSRGGAVRGARFSVYVQCTLAC
jgi:hypothetical protein